MIAQTLGLPVDIHGGGHDLIFPHHENEIAQGRCADHVDTYANYWMHNGFLTLDAEKMSKSVGNVLLVHELVKTIPGEVVRFALLSAHYRAPLDWTDELLLQSRRSLDRLYGALQDAALRTGLDGRQPLEIPAQEEAAQGLAQSVVAALEDDLNTPGALAALAGIAGSLREALMKRKPDAAAWQRALTLAGDRLGFLQAEVDVWFKQGADEALKARIEALIAERGAARLAKDWAAADRIRGELTQMRVEVLDSPHGAATWRLKTD
jgi:cysteinyl-tRNA synthetase